MTVSAKKYREMIAQNFNLLKIIRQLKARLYKVSDEKDKLKEKLKGKDDNL